MTSVVYDCIIQAHFLTQYIFQLNNELRSTKIIYVRGPPRSARKEMQDKKAGASSVHDLPTSTLKRVEWDNVYFLLSNT